MKTRKLWSLILFLLSIIVIVLILQLRTIDNAHNISTPKPVESVFPTVEPTPTMIPVEDLEPTVAPSETPITEVFNMNDYFYSAKIENDLFQRIDGKSYKKDCTIPLDDLRYVKVLYYGFDEETHIGELIVNKAIAKDISNIFKELYEAEYPIEKICLIDEYDADDIESMADNNTSAFNYRVIDGTNKLSNHAKGMAIDINPLYNPYVRYKNGKEDVLPKNAEPYSDRTKKNPYYIDKDDFCYKTFIKYGFTWGGEWNNSKDYQHFEKK